MPKLSRKLYFAMLSVLLLCLVLAGCNVFSGSSQSGAAHSAAAGTTAARLPVAVQAAAATPAVLAPQPAGAPAAGATTQGGTAPAVEATSEVNTAAPTPGDAISTTVPLSSTVDPDTAALLAQDTIPARDLRSLAMRLRPGAGNIPVVVNATPPNFKVGDQQRFWVGNEDTQEHRQITATLKYMTPHVYMWVENGANVDQAGLEKSANLFETKTYPTDRQFFGSEWTPGVDNDAHLNLLHATNLGATIAGAFSGADEYSHLANPYSNEKEMFYISIDPDRGPPGSSFYDGALAHEFQHMIHWANDRNEESWVNEGMSMLAENLNGFEVGGMDQSYSTHPNTQLDTWSSPSQSDTTSHYGASYLFMEYFLSRFGPELMKAVVADHEHGISGFNDAPAKAGRSERFDDIFADWLVANEVNQPQADPKGRFGYSNINPQPPVLFKSYQNFPVQDQAQVNQYAADFIDLKPTGDLSIDFKGQTTVPLVNAKPAGKYAWWSNRGDDDDSTLTRTVDLTKVPTATLTFSTWYNIENGYDYVYVEASTDNGRHWQILPGQHTNSNDKSGNAYGPGWTGLSGGGDTPQWIDERVDLTPFAGKEVQLRFEYVTDDAVNGPGFLLDNIAIPEIGFYDGGENGTNGWQASGWTLTDNTLDERWLVQVVESGQNTVHVDRMKVGPDGHGTLSVPGAANYDSVKLIVSGLAPVTTEPASFSYTITQQTNATPAAPTVSPLPGQPSPVPTTTVAQPSASQPAVDASQSPAAPAVTSDVPLGALATQPASLSAESAIPTYTYKVVHEYPHDPTAWTEGLVYQNGYLYESTGIEGQSSLRKVNLDTGQVVQRYDIPNQYYGEGIALYGDKIAQLTWKNHAGFVYDQASFKPVGQFTYSGEGWGLTYDSQYVIMSDGTDVLRFLDPETFQEKNRISVSANGTPVTQLNELEYINGEIYANIWQTDRIARINPNTGQVTGWVDLAGLLSPADRQRDVDVLNGIAYDAEGQRLFVTGKLWPKLFEIHLLPQS